MFLSPENDDFQLYWQSPCRDGGYDSVLVRDTMDLYAKARRVGTIDIGADESSGCWRHRLELTAQAVYADIGAPVQVTAHVADASSGAPEPGYRVDISVDVGEITSVTRNGTVVNLPGGTQSTYGVTDVSGNVYANVTRNTPGVITVTARISNLCDTQEMSKTTKIRFHDPSAAPVEIFFCLDATGSMSGIDGDRRATESVAKFLNDMAAEGFPLRVGGIKFNGPVDAGQPCSDVIEMEHFVSLSSFSTVGTLISGWVHNGYLASGGDPKELQLDALHLAVQDMNVHSTSGNSDRYIVLITDNEFHENICGSTVTKQQVINELTASGCSVHISLFDRDIPSLAANYSMLDVNNGTIESAQYNAPLHQMYPLSALRLRIWGN